MTVPFPEEITYLEVVEENLHDALSKLDKTITDYEEEYEKARNYLLENWNEIDSMEIFSNQRSISEVENAGKLSLERRNKIEKLIQTPYFARIDFQYEGIEEDTEQVYIGSFGFTDSKNQILVYDWRAPISSLYYDYELGLAAYQAPAGEINGEIVRKRQFKIKDGQMIYALESAISIDDDVLQRELSSTSDEKMKTIIATIQKEQNKIIRNEKANILVIQGVAGSGKTSIALHRVAYLLYRYKERLSASQVAIISPNKVFADYISNVLPELGEEPIVELNFEEIAAAELSDKLTFERFTDHMDHPTSQWLERSRLKSTTEFISLMDDYLDYAAHTYFEPQECSIHHVIISKEYIQGRYTAYKHLPIFKRFVEMANDILEQIKTNPPKGHRLPGLRSITKKLLPMFQIKKTLDLYTDFFSHINKSEQFVFAHKNKLEWPDVFPYLYFKNFLEGIDHVPTIQHLVIDEMQDYTPAQYAVISKLYSCKKTILGDFGQAVNPYNHPTVDTFRSLFGEIDYMELNKSYRSTYEIIDFAKKIQNHQKIEAMKRHGDKPDLIHCQDWQSELTAIKERLLGFCNSDYATLGILCKDASSAQKLYQELCDEFSVTLLDSDSRTFEQGITITTIFMSKGLEFDEVLIPYANAETYHSEFDRSLLYVASTRAMHKLTLSYHEKLSPIV